MVQQSSYHSIWIDEKKCIGCVRCMQACPTKAIRVHKRKAHINYERCIDCGECLRTCPYKAVIPLTTSPSDLDRFDYIVALSSPVLFSQFDQKVQPGELLSALQQCGFDHVYDVGMMCEMTSIAIEEYLKENTQPRPIISSTCPVVVRLIQRLFPSLCDLIIPLEPPREVAAKNLRKEITTKHKIVRERIGIIHITPCAAKVVSINHPITMKKSNLDGAFSIRDIYNRTMSALKKSKRSLMLDVPRRISSTGMGWAMTGGEINTIEHKGMVSVSGVYDTIRILGDVESGRLKNIEYLECLICPDGCIGGPLTVENRFVAKSNVMQLIKKFGARQTVDANAVRRMYKNKYFSFPQKVKPNPFPPLDRVPSRALRKLKTKEKIIRQLPGIDCGICGAPDCKTFAEDIVRREAKMNACIFYHYEKRKNKKKN